MGQDDGGAVIIGEGPSCELRFPASFPPWALLIIGIGRYMRPGETNRCLLIMPMLYGTLFDWVLDTSFAE